MGTEGLTEGALSAESKSGAKSMLEFLKFQRFADSFSKTHNVFPFKSNVAMAGLSSTPTTAPSSTYRQAPSPPTTSFKSTSSPTTSPSTYRRAPTPPVTSSFSSSSVSKSNFCTGCGNGVAGAKFCSNCGVKV
eukprot:gene6161-7133_t